MYKAGVVIPTMNPGALFEKVLSAVMAQDPPWEYEVLVIDSGSTDGTVEYCQQMEAEHKNFRLHQIPQEEFGHGKTRNLGVSMMTAEFVALITHDALPADKHWLDKLVASVEAYPDIAGAFGRHLPYPDASPFTKRDLQLHFDSIASQGRVWIIGDKRRYELDSGYRSFLHFYSDNNACLRRSVWEKVPYPEVDFAEDQMWAERILKEGYAKAYADDAIVYHSHNYSPIENYKRSFAESQSLYALFGYRMCDSVLHLLKNTFCYSMRDFRYLLKQGRLLKNINWFFRLFPDNFLRQLGGLNGYKAELKKLNRGFVK